MQTGGFSEAAEHLGAHYGQPVSRQQVFQWYKRHTRNKAGRPFPREVETDLNAPHGRPR